MEYVETSTFDSLTNHLSRHKEMTIMNLIDKYRTILAND